MKQKNNRRFALRSANLKSWRWFGMSDGEKLETLMQMLEEDDGCRTLSDGALEALIAEANGDLRRAAYLGALRKARNDAITLPDGTRLESQREYWLTVARSYRTNFTGGMPRADGL